jgi:hypothetical protein
MCSRAASTGFATTACSATRTARRISQPPASGSPAPHPRKPPRRPARPQRARCLLPPTSAATAARRCAPSRSSRAGTGRKPRRRERTAMVGTRATRPGTRSPEGSVPILPIVLRASRRASFPPATDLRARPGRPTSVSHGPHRVRHTGLVAIPPAGARFESPWLPRPRRRWSPATAGSSLEAWQTPAGRSPARTARSVVEGRHLPTLNGSGQACRPRRAAVTCSRAAPPGANTRG